MIELSFKEIADLLGGTIIGLDPQATTGAVPVLDSRKAGPGTFFVALPGERADGNDFAAAAVAAGAEFALMSVAQNVPGIVVKDVALALTTLAAHVRALLTQCTFIAITGSQGKTTTKDLVGQILSIRGATVVPEGSFNNDLGVPLTILQCNSQTQYCVLEMGARHIGDIARLVKLAKPSIGVVLVVGSAHVGEFGSRAAIAAAKSEIVSELEPGATAILGNYDPFTPEMKTKPGVKRVIFGQSAHADVRAADIEMRSGAAHFDLVASGGRASVGLKILGEHQVANALAASAIALEAGMSIEQVAQALSEAEISSKWRMEIHRVGDCVIINDSYNANPESVKAALKTLVLLAQESGGTAWAYLGKMHELGELERESHLEIGRLASELGVDHLVCVGTDLYFNGLGLSESDSLSVHNVLTQEQALELSSHIEGGDVVLIKASRAEHLDELAEKLLARLQQRESESEHEDEGEGVEQ